MKRKQDIETNGEQIDKPKKSLKWNQTNVTLSYYNKNRGTLRIHDNCLKCFFAEFANAAKTPLHFYVVRKSMEELQTMESKFKVISDSFIRMVACFLIRHR